MINGILEQFLDTGWYTDAELYYRGYIYWCQGVKEESGQYHFWVVRWRVKNFGYEYYKNYSDRNGEPYGWGNVHDEYADDFELLKKHFLQAPIFEGKSFWQVEKEIAWLEHFGKDIIVDSADDVPEYIGEE